MSRKASSTKRNAVLALLVFGVLLGTAWARIETVLYSFCPENYCHDGAYPSTSLIFDQKGNLYGTTPYGGAYESGTVFKLTPDGKETVVHSFGGQNGDGFYPSVGLIVDREGNLYGTTASGGSSFGGTVFKLTPAGKETILYNFCAQSNCSDGASPGGLVFDQKGNLYGTTLDGGIPNNCYLGCGVVFKLTPEGKETVLYSFCPRINCSDGQFPEGSLVIDRKGNLYGTVSQGGAQGAGAVFKITSGGKETVLHSFGTEGDGQYPEAGVIFDQIGNLYGTTDRGGAHGAGTVFKLAPAGKETVLYSFCHSQTNCSNGAYPTAGLIFDQKGNLYGTTGGGGDGYGTAFKLTAAGKETVLYNFCGQDNCADGKQPFGGLVFDQKGNLYGTTYIGGLTVCTPPDVASYSSSLQTSTRDEMGRFGLHAWSSCE